jgi:hypothetical protein
MVPWVSSFEEKKYLNVRKSSTNLPRKQSTKTFEKVVPICQENKVPKCEKKFYQFAMKTKYLNV